MYYQNRIVKEYPIKNINAFFQVQINLIYSYFLKFCYIIRVILSLIIGEIGEDFSGYATSLAHRYVLILWHYIVFFFNKIDNTKQISENYYF